MISRPFPLLPFDHLGAEQLAWDGATEEITGTAPVRQAFRCAHDALHRIEVFLEPTFHFKRSHLWLHVFAGDLAPTPPAARPPPLRIAGPLAAESLVAHGWFGFEFEPIARSAGQTFTFELRSPDATPGNALSVRARSRDGALAFRAVCVRAPRLLENFHHYRRRAAPRTGAVDHLPLMVRLEISKPCNLHCIMCQRGQHPFVAREDAPGFMSLTAFRTLDPVLPTLLRVIALGLGEPFLNPQLLDILRHARAANPFAHLFTSTNGTRLSDDAIDAILDEGLLSEIQISLDGAERETFEQIRVKASFDTVVGAFERVIAARARRGTRSLSVTAAMLVMKPNLNQVTAFARRMLALGVDRISLDSPKDAEFKPLRAESNDEMARIFEQVALVDEVLAGTGTTLSGPLLSELMIWHRTSGQTWTPPRWGPDECAQLARPPGTPVAACGVPWESFTLAANGDVNVCCNSIRHMGDLRHSSLDAVWANGAPYAGIRDELLTRRLHSDCRTCIGENFVRCDEMTPASYSDGCLPATHHTAALAWQLGRRVEPSPQNASAGLSTGIAIAGRRICGWIESTADWPTAKPIPLAIALGGVVRELTCAAIVTPRFAQWSAAIDGVPPPVATAAVEVFLVIGDELRRVPLRPQPELAYCESAGGQLHGYVDEVRFSAGAVHFIGWARDATTRAPAARVALVANGDSARSLRPWLPRPDVARAFGGTALNFGFSIELPLESFAPLAPGSLTLLAVDEHGAATPLTWGQQAITARDRFLARRDTALPAVI